MKTQIGCGVGTEVGKNNAENQDNYYFNPSQGIFIVADGMGGEAFGEEASSFASRDCGKTLEKLLKEQPDMINDEDTFKKELRKIIRRINNGLLREMKEKHIQSYINEMICKKNLADKSEFYDGVKKIKEKNENLKVMGTTLDILLINKDKAYLGHIGDGRIGALKNDDTFEILMKYEVGPVEEDGEIIENLGITLLEHIEEGKFHYPKPLYFHNETDLNKFLGNSKFQEEDIEIDCIDLDDVKSLVLYTDGFDSISSSTIGNVLKNNSAQDAADKLIYEASFNPDEKVVQFYSEVKEVDIETAKKKRSRKDDMTAIVVNFEESKKIEEELNKTSDLEEQLHEKELYLEQKSQELDSETNKNKKLSTNLEEQEKNYSELKREKSELEVKLDNKDKKIQELEAKLTRQEDYSELKKQKSTLEKENSELKQDIDSEKEKNEKIKSNLTNKMDYTGELENKNQELASEIESIKEQIETLSSQSTGEDNKKLIKEFKEYKESNQELINTLIEDRKIYTESNKKAIETINTFTKTIKEYQEKTDSKISEIEKEIKEKPIIPSEKNKLDLFERARDLYLEGNYEDAKSSFEKILDHKNPLILSYYNHSLAEIGEWDKAINYCNQGLANNSKNGKNHNLLGCIYISKGKKSDAISSWNKAAKCGNTFAMYNLSNFREYCSNLTQEEQNQIDKLNLRFAEQRIDDLRFIKLYEGTKFLLSHAYVKFGEKTLDDSEIISKQQSKLYDYISKNNITDKKILNKVNEIDQMIKTD